MDDAIGEGDRAIDWPLRPWALAGLLGVAGLLVWAFSHDSQDIPWRMAATGFVFFGGIAAAFTLDRGHWREPLAFAFVAGLVMAGLAWRAVAAGDHYADEQYGFGAGVIATALALPLFQSGFHRTRFSTPYERVHYNVWTDAISAGGALAFTGAAWLLLAVLSELFKLLEMRFLADLMDDGWFGWTFSGAAFGAALGVLRNELRILGTLQRVVMIVLSILAVPLAMGLVLFLVAMVVSGPEVLWRATRSATPVLLMCAAGAWVLANALLRANNTEMSGKRQLRGTAIVLALSILPLTVFAAISMGTRVAQHGLSPERLWGLVAVGVACAYGLAWLVAVLRGWKSGGWRERLRQANLHLAATICVVALLLALPIFDFGAISARNQVARLERGDVRPDAFDYAALRWDFGDAGRRALARLEHSDVPRVAELSKLALSQSERVYTNAHESQFRDADEIDVRVQPDDPALRAMVIDYLRSNRWHCEQFCVAQLVATQPGGRREVAFVEGETYAIVTLPAQEEPIDAYPPQREERFGRESKVEIRPLERHYIYIDGRRVGEPIEDRLEATLPRR